MCSSLLISCRPTIAASQITASRECILDARPDQGSWLALWGEGVGRQSAVCAQRIARWHCDTCALLSRVLESLLVSLVTTVVVFVASMVLGECRQMSSTSQTGNGSVQLQVTLAPSASVLQSEKCVLYLRGRGPWTAILPTLSEAQAALHGKPAH